MPSVVLVTGVSSYLGSRLAGQLAGDPSIDRVIGVDVTAPTRADVDRIGRTEFVRADIRNPLISRMLDRARVDTVVHASVTATPARAGGRAPMKEFNVIGTMQLLAACQKLPTVRRLVVKSTTAVYGASPRDPAVFTETTPTKGPPRGGYAKDAVEVESYVRGFARRRPDTTVTVLRFANFIGPSIESPVTRYLTLPVVPTPLGFDPRLQFVHEDDAVEVLRSATIGERHPAHSGYGVFNVAGAGTLVLSQAVRRAGRIGVPVPAHAVTAVADLVRRVGLVDFSPEQLDLLTFGRVVDASKLATEFGHPLRYTTPTAFESFLAGRPVMPVIAPERLGEVERRIESAAALLSRFAGVAGAIAGGAR